MKARVTNLLRGALTLGVLGAAGFFVVSSVPVKSPAAEPSASSGDTSSTPATARTSVDPNDPSVIAARRLLQVLQQGRATEAPQNQNENKTQNQYQYQNQNQNQNQNQQMTKGTQR